MTTDNKATYYDLDINGTTVETRDIVRAVLERAGLGAHASHQLGKVLERAIRLGAKPGTDVAREVEKIHIEAGMLRDAVRWNAPLREVIEELREVYKQTDWAKMDDPIAECHRLRHGDDAPANAAEPITDDDAEDAAPEDVCRGLLFDVGSRLGFREGTHVVNEAERVAARIAELERELREARHEASRERELTTEKVDMVRDLGSDLVGARRELAEVRKKLSELERERDEAREAVPLVVIEEAKNIAKNAPLFAGDTISHASAEMCRERGWAQRNERGEWVPTRENPFAEHAARLAAMRDERDRWRQTAERAQSDLDTLRRTLEAERDSYVRLALERDRWCEETGGELERVRRELDDLRDRYRPRRQSEEPAPPIGAVLQWDTTDDLAAWCYVDARHLDPGDTWTHQPPAPEGD